MSKYLLDKFLFTVDRDPALVERYREDPVGTVDWWEREMANKLLNCVDMERSTWLELTAEERRALREQDPVALFSMGAHPFLTLTLFIAMFERDHGPLEYQKAYGAMLRHVTLPYPDISTDVRAAVLHSLGRPPQHGDHPDPRPVVGESLVRVTAAPVVPLDLLCASGTSYFGAPEVPYVPGVQGVGVVRQSESFDVGTRVWFTTSAGMAPGDGGLAELVAVPDENLVAVTEPIDDHELAALGLSAVAAWMSLTWKARLRAGERVLVLGGGGAVGQTAIGAARALGAGRVVAVCRSEAAANRARAAGAAGVVVAPDATGLVDHLRDACDGPVDVVIDPVFGAAAEAASSVLADGGRLVNLGGAAGDSATFSSATLRSRSAQILGYTNNALTAEQRRTAIEDISRHAANGDLAVAHEVHPLADIEQVWSRQSSGRSPVRFVLSA